MRVACVLMQRNEVNALRPWLLYHGYLFGPENLFVIDHGSDHPTVIKVLEHFETQGVHVFRLPAAADYRCKGDYVTQVLRGLDQRGVFDMLMPLDCDEFVVLRDNVGAHTSNRTAILAHLATLRGRPEVLEVKQNLINILGAPGKFWVMPYQKVFFAGGHCGAVDHGSHADTSGRRVGTWQTSISYLHFHHKPHLAQMQASREKLAPYVDVDDPEALASFRGTGWHLIQHVLGTETSYLSMMKATSETPEVAGLLELFAALGIDPLFTEL